MLLLFFIRGAVDRDVHQSIFSCD